MSRPRLCRAVRNRRGGNALLEFALWLPILMVVISGIVDLSMYLSTLQAVSRAARDGARVGSAVIEGSAPTGATIRAEAEDQSIAMLDEMGRTCTAVPECTVTTSWEQISGTSFIRVLVSYPFDPLVGLTTFLPDHASAEFVMMTQEQLVP